MWPLLIAGAGLQFAGAQDKSTAMKLAIQKYMDNLKALQARSVARYQTLGQNLQQLQPQFSHNVIDLARGVTSTAPVGSGIAQAQGNMNSAVKQVQDATAGIGTYNPNGGSAADADVKGAAAAHYADVLGKLQGQMALGNGLEQEGMAQNQAMSQYGTEDTTLRRKIADLFGVADVGDMADQLNRANNESVGQSNMRFAQGVGNNSIQLGQLAQLGGLAWGGYGSSLMNAFRGAQQPGRTNSNVQNGGWAGLDTGSNTGGGQV